MKDKTVDCRILRYGSGGGCRFRREKLTAVSPPAPVLSLFYPPLRADTHRARRFDPNVYDDLL
jgi:hypothetical protein